MSIKLWNDLESIKQYVEQMYPNKITVLITGANAGIGYNTALCLAKIGCSLIITCRTVEKCIETCQKITTETGNTDISYIDLELSSYDSIDSFPSKYESLNQQVDVLVNNAGISMVLQYKQSHYNQEINFQINYLSTIRFTERFLPYLKKASNPILCFTTSISIHDVHPKEINDDFMHMSNKKYNWYKAYARSKFCLTAYSLALSHRESQITVLLLDPGVVATNIARDTCLGHLFISWIGRLLFPIEQAIYNSLYCILNQDLHQHQCHIYRRKKETPFPKLLMNSETIEYIYNYTQQLIRN